MQSFPCHTSYHTCQCPCDDMCTSDVWTQHMLSNRSLTLAQGNIRQLWPCKAWRQHDRLFLVRRSTLGCMEHRCLTRLKHISWFGAQAIHSPAKKIVWWGFHYSQALANGCFSATMLSLCQATAKIVWSNTWRIGSLQIGYVRVLSTTPESFADSRWLAKGGAIQLKEPN